MADKLTTGWLTVFVTAFREREELIRTINVLSDGFGDNIYKIVVVLKDENCPAALELGKYLDETHNSKVEPYIQKFRSQNGMNSYIGCVSEIIFMCESSHFIVSAADLEYDSDTLRRMIDAEKNNPDAIVSASRWIKGAKVTNYSSFNKLMCKCFNLFISLTYGRRVTDFSCIFQIYPVELLNTLKIDYSYDISFVYVFIPLRAGMKYIEVPAVFEKNNKSSFKFFYVYRIGIQYIYYIMKVRFKPKKSLFRNS